MQCHLVSKRGGMRHLVSRDQTQASKHLRRGEGQSQRAQAAAGTTVLLQMCWFTGENSDHVVPSGGTVGSGHASYSRFDLPQRSDPSVAGLCHSQCTHHIQGGCDGLQLDKHTNNASAPFVTRGQLLGISNDAATLVAGVSILLSPKGLLGSPCSSDSRISFEISGLFRGLI